MYISFWISAPVKKRDILPYYCNAVCPCEYWRSTIQLLSFTVFNGSTSFSSICEFNPWSLLKKNQDNPPPTGKLISTAILILCLKSETRIYVLYGWELNNRWLASQIMQKMDEIKKPRLTKQLSAHEELNISLYLTEIRHQSNDAC